MDRPANSARPDGSTPALPAYRISVARSTPARSTESPTSRSSCAVAPASRAASIGAGVVFRHPLVTAASTAAGLKAANAAHTTLHGAAPRHALREQKYPSK